MLLSNKWDKHQIQIAGNTGNDNIGDDDLFNLPVKLGELRVRLAP